MDFKKFWLTVPFALLALLCAAFLAGSVIFFVYFIVIAVAWNSNMVNLIVAGACALALGLGLLGIEGIKSYKKFYLKKLGMLNKEEAKKKSESKSEQKPKFEKLSKYLSFTNISFGFVIIGSVLVVASALLGSLERGNWVDAKADYMEQRGYYADIQHYDVSHFITQENINIDQINLDLGYKTAVIIYDETGYQDRISVNGIMFYHNQIQSYYTGVDTNILIVKDNPPPELTEPIDKMLFFLFKGNKYETQIKIRIPAAFKDTIVVHGKYIVAQN